MRKLKWVLLLFVVVALFASCDVWISFWGSGLSGSSLSLKASMSSTYVNPFYSSDRLEAIIYKDSGGTYYQVSRAYGYFGSRSLDTTFSGLEDGDYFLTVWRDSDYDNYPDYNSENGVTTGTFYVSGDLTLIIQTDSDWQTDGSAFVTHP